MWNTRSICLNSLQDFLSVQPWPTEGESALNLSHQEVCSCVTKLKERLFPPSLNFVRSKLLLRRVSDHTRVGVQVFEILLWWLNDGKDQMLFFNHITLHKRLFQLYPTVNTHENYLPLRQLIHINWNMSSLTVLRTPNLLADSNPHFWAAAYCCKSHFYLDLTPLHAQGKARLVLCFTMGFRANN